MVNDTHFATSYVASNKLRRFHVFYSWLLLFSATMSQLRGELVYGWRFLREDVSNDAFGVKGLWSFPTGHWLAPEHINLILPWNTIPGFGSKQNLSYCSSNL